MLLLYDNMYDLNISLLLDFSDNIDLGFQYYC